MRSPIVPSRKLKEEPRPIAVLVVYLSRQGVVRPWGLVQSEGNSQILILGEAAYSPGNYTAYIPNSHDIIAE